MILDDEVFAVIIAITIVASALAAAQILVTGSGEPFIALGLLDGSCMIGNYPSRVPNGSYVDLCIFVYNHMGKPIYYKVIYRIGSPSDLPTNTTPSKAPAIMEWRGALKDGGETKFRVRIPVYIYGSSGMNATLIFEAWIYSTEKGGWIYSGVWNHLHVFVNASG